MTDAKFGSFDDLLKITANEMKQVATRLREIILDVHPGAIEVVRLGDRAATYGLGPKKMSEGYAYVLPYERWVNLGFYKGVDLPDPGGLMEGTGARMRHVKIRTMEEAERPAVRNLIEAALRERRESLET